LLCRRFRFQKNKRFTWHDTHHGEFFGVPATGKQIRVKGMAVDRVVAGKMAASRILMDTLGIMTQLGAISLCATENAAATALRHGMPLVTI